MFLRIIHPSICLCLVNDHFFMLQVNAYDGDLALAVDPHMDEALDRAMICPLCGVQLPSCVEVL